MDVALKKSKCLGTCYKFTLKTVKCFETNDLYVNGAVNLITDMRERERETVKSYLKLKN